MTSSDFLETYRLVEPTIRKLYDSGLRLGILDALKKGPMRLADLRRAINANAPNTSAKAKELEEMGLVRRESGDYKLTPWGEIILDSIKDSVQLFLAKEKLDEYWSTHKLKGIPKDLQSGMKAYAKADLIKPKANDIDYVDRHYFELVMAKTKTKFWGMTPVFRNEYLDMLLPLIQKGIQVKLILQKDIISSVLSLIPDEFKEKLSTAKNFELYSIDELELAMSISDEYCTCGFQVKEGPQTYMDMNPESTDKEMIDFETKVFNYYLKKAKRVEL